MAQEDKRLASVTAWPAASIFLAAGLATEGFPFLFGAGAQARWDWGFLYVTLRFIILPALAVAPIAFNGLVALHRSVRGAPLLFDLASVTLPLFYLGTFYLIPVFLFHIPWWEF